MMPPPVLILAICNESRGDDAVAPLLLREFGKWLEQNGLDEKFELLEDFQLQIEHAADLAGRELVLFMDAGMNTPAPYSFHRARARDERTAFSHAIAPEAVLSTYAQVYHQPPPPAFILCIPGEHFELGETLSPAAKQRMSSALDLLKELAQNPRLSNWESRSTPA